MNDKENILMFFVLNQFRFKNQLNSYVMQKESLLKSEDSSLHNDIKNQFNEYVSSVLVDDVTKHLAISTEEAMIAVESINLDEYLRM